MDTFPLHRGLRCGELASGENAVFCLEGDEEKNSTAVLLTENNRDRKKQKYL